MNARHISICILLFCILTACQRTKAPYQWLEDVDGKEALAWVAAHNEQTLDTLQAQSTFDSIYRKSLEIYRTQERTSSADVRGEYVYELWRDEAHERGLWRRAPLDSYLSDDPSWETLLDVDSLAEAEGKDWVFSVGKCLPPEFTHCMVRLSRRGRDAAEAREFDVESKTFVEGGFVLPEARNDYEWKDANTLLVATDFGEGTTTEFGWPRIVKEWRRGTPSKRPRSSSRPTPQMYTFGPLLNEAPTDPTLSSCRSGWPGRNTNSLRCRTIGSSDSISLPTLVVDSTPGPAS